MGVSTAVLGIGNILLGDEGVGVHAVKALGERYELPEEVGLIDGGTMGLDLLAYIEGLRRLLIVDAASFKEAPGTIKVIDGKDVKAFLDTRLSVHQIGLSDMLAAASLKGVTPPELCVVGIEPEHIGVSLELSGTLSARLDALLNTIIERLALWGITPLGRRA